MEKRILALLLATAIAVANLAAGAHAAAPIEREVSFVTSDGVRVSATLLGAGTSAVALGHMLGGDRGDWLSFARGLTGDGYMVLAFDFRGHGKSTKRPIANLDRDMLAAAAFLKGQGARRVALVGASMGGTAAIKAAASGAASAVIAISSPQTYGAYVTAADLRRITIPSLWIVAEDDADFVQSMRIMWKGAGGVRRFQEFPGSWHGTQFFDAPFAGVFRNLMVGFLRRAVPPQ